MKHKLQNLLKHKLQWLMLLAALLGVSQGVWADTPLTIYCAVTDSELSSADANTVKANAKVQGNPETWSAATMTKTGATHNGVPVYSGTIQEKYGGVDILQIQLLNGSTWKAQRVACSSWKTSSEISGQIYVYSSGSWETYTPCSAPTISSVSVTNIRPATATVSASYTGGTNISSRSFSISPSSGVTISTPSCTSGTCTANITGLTAGTSYTVTFSIVDDCGTTTNTHNFSTCYKYFDGNTYLYIDVTNPSWFTDASAIPNMQFDDGSWSDAELVTGKIYRIKPAAGCYSTFGIRRRHGTDYWNTCSSNSFSAIGNNNKLDLGANWCKDGNTGNCIYFSWSSYTPCTTPTKSQYTMASGQSVTYDGSAHAPSITVNNSAGSVAKIYGSTDNGTNWTYYATGPINAGTYNIKVDVNAGGDYCAASGIILDNTYAITQKTPTASDFNFSNLAQTLPTTIVAVGVTPKSGITGMGSVTVKYDGFTTLPTTAGTYAVTFDVAAGTNYSAATGLSAGNLVISKSNQTTPTVSDLDSHCGTGDYALSASNGESKGYYSYAIVSDGTTGTATIVNNETESVTLRVSAVGAIIVKAKKLGDANYNESAYSANKTFTIKANSIASQYTIESGHNMDYTGSALTPTITTASGAGDISKYYYSSDNGSTWTAGKPTNAGVYKIKVDVAEGTSYCAANGIVITNTFTINQIDQPTAVTIDNETTSYCVSTLGTNIALEASGGDGTGAYSFKITGGTVAADKRRISGSTLTVSGAGTVILQATRDADTNYNAKNSATVTFTFTANGPKVFTLTNEGATALCGKGDGSSTGTGGSLRLTGSETGYSYQLKKDDANYGDPVPGTGSALTFPVTASGVYTCTAYYGDPSQCPTEMNVEEGGIVLVVNITPRLLPGTPTVRQYQAVTITSTNTEIDKWVLSGEGADAYTYDSTPNSITLKANTAGSPYRLIATTSAGCTATAVITVIADTENCVP